MINSKKKIQLAQHFPELAQMLENQEAKDAIRKLSQRTPEKNIRLKIEGSEISTFKGERGLKGEKGDKGERGNDGKNGEDGYSPILFKDYLTPTHINTILKTVTPKKGVDYVDGKDGKVGRDGLDGRDGKDGTNGKDGKDATINPKVIGSMVSEKVLEGMKEVDGRIKAIDMRWRGGGGLTRVSHDTTLTGSGTPSDPLSVTSSPASVTYSQTPVGVIDGVNKVFTVLHTISFVFGLYTNGQFIHPTDYSTAGTTITFNTAPDVSLAGLPITVIYN